MYSWAGSICSATSKSETGQGVCCEINRNPCFVKSGRSGNPYRSPLGKDSWIILCFLQEADIPCSLLLSALYHFHSNAKLRAAHFPSGEVVTNGHKYYPSYL